MKRVVKKMILALIFLIILFSIRTEVQALSNAIDDGKNFISTGENEGESYAAINPSNLQSLSGYLYNMLLAIGVIVAVAVSAVLGIQFIVGGAEGQAKVKEMLVPFIVGCIVVFGGFGIWKIAITVGNAIEDASIENHVLYEIAIDK